jgi:hypothetical protein
VVPPRATAVVPSSPPVSARPPWLTADFPALSSNCSSVGAAGAVPPPCPEPPKVTSEQVQKASGLSERCQTP